MTDRSCLKAAMTTMAGALAVCLSNQASAARTVVFGPEAFASATATTGDAAAGADIRNGVSNPTFNYAHGMATTSTASLAVGGTTVKGDVTTTSLAAPGRTSSAGSYSSLDNGTLKAQIIQSVPKAFGFPGADTTSQFQDTFFFTNTSGSSANLNLTFSFEGTATAFEPGTLNGLAYLLLSGCGACSNSFGQDVRFAGTGLPASIAAYSEFTESGVNRVYDQFAGGALNPLDFSVLTNTKGIGSIIQTTIVIPVGETSLGFKTYLNLSARSAASADFGHTARFGVGPLSSGLSFSTASGVFLKGIVAPSAAVPEPSTWVMMLFGFALVGSTLRQRATRGTVMM